MSACSTADDATTLSFSSFSFTFWRQAASPANTRRVCVCVCSSYACRGRILGPMDLHTTHKQRRPWLPSREKQMWECHQQLRTDRSPVQHTAPSGDGSLGTKPMDGRYLREKRNLWLEQDGTDLNESVLSVSSCCHRFMVLCLRTLHPPSVFPRQPRTACRHQKLHCHPPQSKTEKNTFCYFFFLFHLKGRTVKHTVGLSMFNEIDLLRHVMWYLQRALLSSAQKQEHCECVALLWWWISRYYQQKHLISVFYLMVELHTEYFVLQWIGIEIINIAKQACFYNFQYLQIIICIIYTPY